MSTQSQINRLISAKAAIKESIENKGVSVPQSTKLDGIASYIDQIINISFAGCIEVEDDNGSTWAILAGNGEPGDIEITDGQNNTWHTPNSI